MFFRFLNNKIVDVKHRIIIKKWFLVRLYFCVFFLTITPVVTNFIFIGYLVQGQRPTTQFRPNNLPHNFNPNFAPQNYMPQQPQQQQQNPYAMGQQPPYNPAYKY